MKPHLRSLKKGQDVWAIVEETIALEELVINFSGDLVRVKNQSTRNFRAGQRVLLRVESVTPLKLKLVYRGSLAKRSEAALDLSI